MAEKERQREQGEKTEGDHHERLFRAAVGKIGDRDVDKERGAHLDTGQDPELVSRLISSVPDNGKIK